MATEGEAKMQRLETTVAKLEELVKGLAAWKASAEATRQREASRPAATGGEADVLTLPNYGRSKGQPVRDASMQDLQFYRSGCERSLNDPIKARFHAKEQMLLEAIDPEIARQAGGGSGRYDGHEDPPSPSDDDAPPDDSTPF